MMMTMTYRRRQEVSILLVLSMVFSLWAAVPARVDAGVLQTVGKALKWTVNTAGTLAATAMGAVVGMAVGGGPIGMVAGGAAGYFVGKKLMNWTTSSVMNFATVAGAVGGGLLVAGMGMPMLAIGVIGGALISRTVVWTIKKLFAKRGETKVNRETVAIQEERSKSIIGRRFSENAAAAAPAATPVSAPAAKVESEEKTSEQVYDQYLSAYRAYMAATQSGDSRAAQQAYTDYQKYLTLYNQMLKSGK